MEEIKQAVEQPKTKKKRVIPKLQIEESHSKPSDETEIQVIACATDSNNNDKNTASNKEQMSVNIIKIKKQPESNRDGSVQSRTSVSTIPIQSN